MYKKIWICFLYCTTQIVFSQTILPVKDIKKGTQKFTEGAVISKQTSKYSAVAEEYLAKAISCHASLKNITLEIRSYKMAAAAFKNAKNTIKEAQTLEALGEVLLNSGNNQQALKILKKSLSLYNSKNYRNLQHLYYCIGLSLYRSGDLISSLKYELLADQDLNNDKNLAIKTAAVKNAIGGCYQKMLQYPKALQYYDQALFIGEKFNDKPLISLSAVNCVTALTNLHKYKEALKLLQAHTDSTWKVQELYVEIYGKLGRLKKWKAHLAKLDRMANKRDNKEYTLKINSFYVDYYLKIKKYNLAYNYLNRYSESCKNYNNVEYTKTKELLWSKADSITGKWLSSIRHLERYKNLNDSIFSLTKRKQDSLLDIEFESEKKDRDILFKTKRVELMEKKTQLQQSLVEHSKNVNNVMIAGTGVLALLLVVSYNSYRSKKNNNTLLLKQQDEINSKNLSLNKFVNKQKMLITEKEWLLREIHHRVKNNLQIVMSLLETQALYLKNPAAISAIVKSQNRVQAMALIHQKLYKSDNSSTVYMPEYINDLVDYLKDAFQVQKTIYFDLAIETINLDVTQVIPLGLILNELVTNAITHAFPNSEHDKISISFAITDQSAFKLIISDNGRGHAKEDSVKKNKSFGLVLVNELVAELSGSKFTTDNKGTTTIIEFDSALKKT